VDSGLAEMDDAASQRALLEERLKQVQNRLVEAQEAADRFAQEQRARQAILSRRREREQQLAQLLALENSTSEIDWRALVERDGQQLERADELITRLLTSAEVLRAGLDSQRAKQRLVAMRRELASSEEVYSVIRDDLESRRRTASATDALLRALRADAEGFVTRRLDQIQPVLEQLYASIDPHPTFRSVRLATHTWYGKNRLTAVLTDEAQSVEVPDPELTLSTSQANALAVALFLAFNLGLRPTTLTSVVLDDPLQNLDDLHLLGLVDLLRRLASSRQVIVTTHDVSFASLLTRKLRPIGEGERLGLIRITNWDRSGPDMVHDIIERDPVPLKLAKA
jgi:DNA repair exonuclease SbcCD ATPase subunit